MIWFSLQQTDPSLRVIMMAEEITRDDDGARLAQAQ